jgi:hypothetical protein
MNSIYNAPESQEHPIVRREYTLDTEPFDELMKHISKWIRHRETGGFAWAPTRTGKSKATEFGTEAVLPADLPHIPICLYICKRHARCSENELLSDLLLAAGHEFPRARSHSVLRDRLLNFCATEARNSGADQFVFFCDEAQYLHIPDYHVFCSLQNELARKKIVLTVISIGAPELWNLRSMLIDSRETYLWMRFFAKNTRFRGIAREHELRFVLEQYDSSAEWPLGSGLSFTQYFFPRSYPEGFRISELTPYLWQLFLDLAPRGTKFKIEIAMEHVARSVEEVFCEFSARVRDAV